MKLVVKIVITVIAAILCFGAYSYIENYEMFELVGDTNATSGYATLATKLQDDEWVAATCEQWESSKSPILSTLYCYATDQSEKSPVAMINDGRALHGFCLILSFACFPLYALEAAFSIDGKRLKELHKS